MGSAERLGGFQFAVKNISRDDGMGADEGRPLNGIEPDAAGAHDHDAAEGLNLGRIQHGAEP